MEDDSTVVIMHKAEFELFQKYLAHLADPDDLKKLNEVIDAEAIFMDKQQKILKKLDF